MLKKENWKVETKSRDCSIQKNSEGLKGWEVASWLTSQPLKVTTVLHLSFPMSRVMDQHKLSRDQWEDRIQVWHAEHRGMLK